MIYTIDEIKNVVTPIARDFGVEHVYLFGSYARGDADATSDIDFRIDRGELKGLKVATFYNALEDAFLKPLDVLCSESLDSDFLQEISGEEILVYAN